MKLGEVGAEDAGGVARGIAGDEDGSEGVGGARLNYVDGLRHFVEFVGTNVGTVAEAEIDLINIPNKPRISAPSIRSATGPVPKYTSQVGPSL